MGVVAKAKISLMQVDLPQRMAMEPKHWYIHIELADGLELMVYFEDQGGAWEFLRATEDAILMTHHRCEHEVEL